MPATIEQGSEESLAPELLAGVQDGLVRLTTGIDRLVARAEARHGRARRPVLLRTDLTELPGQEASIMLCCEFDGLCTTGDMEAALFGHALDERDERQAAWHALTLTLEEAVQQLREAGVRLDPAFCELVEQCTVDRIRVCIISRGVKPLIRAMLREEGIGHVEVFAHDGHFDRAGGGVWRVSFRDHSESGHNKADSIRRAQMGTAASGVVYVGHARCDLAPVLANQVDCLFAPRGSLLAGLCADAGVRHCEFEGWAALSTTLAQNACP
jgi:2-hydroxy-3-keto-5-methylthiopentenyl-1-phosphate phosphatase